MGDWGGGASCSIKVLHRYLTWVFTSIHKGSGRKSSLHQRKSARASGRRKPHYEREPWADTGVGSGGGGRMSIRSLSREIKGRRWGIYPRFSVQNWGGLQFARASLRKKPRCSVSTARVRDGGDEKTRGEGDAYSFVEVLCGWVLRTESLYPHTRTGGSLHLGHGQDGMTDRNKLKKRGEEPVKQFAGQNWFGLPSKILGEKERGTGQSRTGESSQIFEGPLCNKIKEKIKLEKKGAKAKLCTPSGHTQL